MILELKYLFSWDQLARPHCQTDSKTEIDVMVGAILPAYLMMLHETIRNDEVSATQRCNIVSNGYNIVPTLQRCVVLKIVVAYRRV